MLQLLLCVFAADAGDISAAPAAVAYDVLAVTVCSYCIVCVTAALIADAAMYGILLLLLLCLLLQFGVAVCCDKLLLYASLLVSRTYQQKMLHNSDVCCSLAPLKLTSQCIRRKAEQVVFGHTRKADKGTK